MAAVPLRPRARTHLSCAIVRLLAGLAATDNEPYDRVLAVKVRGFPVEAEPPRLTRCTPAAKCGNLTATIDDGADAMTIMCHCIDCQKRTGSPFGVMAYYPDDSVTIGGEAREYSRPTDAGNTFTTGFCPTCGSTLYGKASGFPGIVGVAVGTISDPAFPAPTRSIYEQSRHHWLAMPDTTAGFVKGRDGERSR